MKTILLASLISFGLIALTGCEDKEEKKQRMMEAPERLKKLQEQSRIELNRKYGLDADGKPLKKESSN